MKEKNIVTNICKCDIETDEVSSERNFHLFLDIFSQSIGGHKEFNKRQRAKILFRQICTPSDEAFLLFTIDRFWDNWVYEFTHIKRKSRTGEFAMAKCNRIYMGMKTEGIQKFNALAIEMKSLRTNNERRLKFETSYRKKYATTSNTSFRDHQEEDGTRYEEQSRPKRPKIMACSDLSEDDEDDEIEKNYCNRNISGTTRMQSNSMHQVSIENIISRKNTSNKHNIPAIPPMTIPRNRYWGSPTDKGKGMPSPTTRYNVEHSSFHSGEIYSSHSNSAPLVEEFAQKMTAANNNEVAYAHKKYQYTIYRFLVIFKLITLFMKH